MRLAVVAPLVAPLLPAQAHGNHSLLVDLATGLANRGHDVHVFAAQGSIVPGVAVETVATNAEIAGSFIVPGAAPAETASPAMRHAFEELFGAVLAWRPDAISAHAFDVEAIELAEGLPVAHTLHLPPIVPAVLETARRSRAGFVSVSRAMEGAWADAGVGTSLIRNGVPDLLPGGLPNGPIERIALIPGRVSPEKGTAAAVRAARSARLEPLVVGPAYARDYAERLVAPLLRPGEWLPPVDRGTLARLMARSAVTLMPIDWDEPFGLVAAEAQMAGCPVVAYRRGALPEVVRDGLTGFLVEPGDEAALAAAAGAAATVGRFDRQFIRRDALGRLGIESMLDGYEALLAELAGARIA